MNRRQLLKHAACSTVAMALPTARLFAASNDYHGRFFVTLQAAGAWDVASFCDPKVNQPGERKITQWSDNNDLRVAGRIPYASFAKNSNFFDRHHKKMLVVNGVDAQTNSHTTGELHNWSGRTASGYPSLTSLFAAVNGPDLPIAYINFGGYAETAKIIRYTRLKDLNALSSVLNPNTNPVNASEHYSSDETLALIRKRQQERLQRLRTEKNLLPRQKYTMDAYYQARRNASKLSEFAEMLPESSELVQAENVPYHFTSPLKSEMQLTLMAFKTGSACSADLHLRGFDTHGDHDGRHAPLMGHLTDALDFFWNYAEEIGIADRVTLMISSDFARTPYYNEGNGKDHWPIGSTILMENNPAWGNRVFGATDELQNVVLVNKNTGLPDSNGVRIYPKHIHDALRDYLGISSTPLESQFPLNNTEKLSLFS